MALQGTLDTFALADLVRLVTTTTKTGELAIEADGASGSGRLWFVDGDLVGGEAGRAESAEEALFALLRLEGGTFSFAPDVGPDALDETAARDALEVLAAAQARLDAWRPVEALVPHPDVALHLRDELPGEDVTLSRDAWRQVVAVAGGTTARSFATALDLDEVAAAFAVKDLADQGLVAVDPDGEPAAADDAALDEHLDDDPEPVGLLDPEGPAVAEDDGTDEVDEAEDAGPIVAALLDAEPHDGPVTAGWGAGWDVAPVAGDPFAPGLPADDGGSLDVDLDTYLGGATPDHRYLGGEASALPEALPETAFATRPAAAEALLDEASDDGTAGSDAAGDEDGTPAEPGAATTGTAAAPTADDEALALQLEALSPAAARAVAAAAASDDAGEEGDAGRRVLRRIISSGRG